MRTTFTKLLFPLLLISKLANGQATEVVPNSYASVDASVSFTGPYFASARSYQLLMDASLLTTLMGTDITGLTFRSPTSATGTWPTATTTYNNYDVYVGPAVAIPTATNIFATNEAGPQTLVRSGSLTFPVASFPAGGPSSWGMVTTFTTPYNYTGGNLAVLIRHDGGPGSSRAINAIGTATAGYNTLFKACWLAGYASIGGSQGNFGVIQFTYNTPLAVDLTRFEAIVSNNDVNLMWSTSSEKNSERFIIERSLDGSSYQPVHHIAIAGNSEMGTTYEYTDIDAMAKSNVLYYRLKIEETDGSSKYSKVLKLNKTGVQVGNLAMAPNPVQSVSNISFSLSDPVSVSYQVVDANGRLVLQDNLAGSKGNNSLLTDFSRLPAGSYVLHIRCSEFDDVVRFLKQ